MTRHVAVLASPPPRRGVGAILLVLDFEHGPGATERVVVRGAFAEADGLPEELAADPQEGVTRNTIWLEPGRVVSASLFRVRTLAERPPPAPYRPLPSIGGNDAAAADADVT